MEVHERERIRACAVLHGHGRRQHPCRVGTSESVMDFILVSECKIRTGRRETERILKPYLHSFRRHHVPFLSEASDVLLEVGVHVLKYQVQDGLSLFILPLFEIKQPGRKRLRIDMQTSGWSGSRISSISREK